MKKISITMLVSSFFLMATAVVAYLAGLAQLNSFWWAFGIASALLVLGFVLMLFKQPKLYAVTFVINAIAMGFYLRSWYINRGFNNSLLLMIGVVLLAVVYMLLFVLPLFIPFVNKHYGLYLIIFVLLSLAGYICLLIFTKTTWVSTLGYFGIVQLAFIMGLSFGASDLEEQIFSNVICSYSVLICGIVILAIVVGGDECDASCDCGSPSDFSSPINGKKSSQQNNS